jgi:hypothetical protein
LAALSLSSDEMKIYQNLNKNIYTININYNGLSKKVYLRKQLSLKILNAFTDQWRFYNQLFSLQCGQEDLAGDFKNNIFEISNYSIYNTETLTINYPSVGKPTATFSFDDKRTLNEIENMSAYKITPKGIVSKFKHGGIVVYENNGHGLVCAMTDLGNMEWDVAKNLCDDLILNYYSDWRLPSRDELKYIYNDLFKNKIGGLTSGSYWSFNETYDQVGAYYKNFSDGDFNHTIKSKKNNVRAVRSF